MKLEEYMNNDCRLVATLCDLSEVELDVVIVGSGPAGVAVAEELYASAPDLKVAVIERGGILVLTHFNNLMANNLRRRFIDTFGEHPWEGDLKDGILVSALGGRGIASGAHLRRFDEVDYALWPEGKWPETIIEALDRWYPVAERRRRVCIGNLPGSTQVWAQEQLARFAPTCPPVGVDLDTQGRFEVSRGYDSSVARLWQLLLDDSLRHDERRLWVVPNACAIRFVRRISGCTELECLDTSRFTASVRARAYVLAASPVESARLVLNSGLCCDSVAIGCYLAEHIERRAKVMLRKPTVELNGEGISLVLTPQGSEREDPKARFQVHLRGERRDGQMIVDIGGFAAMDPNSDSRVTLAPRSDSFGLPRAHTSLRMTSSDEERANRLCARICEVADQLGVAKFITDQFPLETFEPRYVEGGRIQVMPPGRSYHEAGTLRIGEQESTSATDPSGKLRGSDNIYIADAALFPSVGIANPMLTVTALAYHVAQSVAFACK
jgi:choline dehydrogenase-like flavoprotein